MVHQQDLFTYFDKFTTLVDIVIPFFSGWNWFSLNVFSDDMSLNNVLGSIEDGASTYIKSQSSFADYYPGYGWYGQLSDINNIEMYKIFMAQSENLEFTGTPVDVAEAVIPLSTGWNWIGYTPQNSLGINTALSNIGPDNATYIKSQAGFADYYSGYGWYGQLSDMDPFLGYQIYMVNEDAFTYPEGAGLTMSFNEYKQQDKFHNISWVSISLEGI